jgi:hypothetical protein
MRFLRKYKFQLLRGALQRGFITFIRQAYVIALDSMVRQKHLVFRATHEDIPRGFQQKDSTLSFREISSWKELREDDRKRLFDPQQAIDFGGVDWFDQGWRLWIGEIDGRLAVLGWWRGAKQSRDFFCSLPEDAELLGHVTTLPDSRGLGLHVMLWVTFMQERIKVGVNSFYTNCREYNIPSHRNILRMGYCCIGYCTVNKYTGHRKWHSLFDKETGV